jgi:cobalt/nickel transport system permease protein
MSVSVKHFFSRPTVVYCKEASGTAHWTGDMSMEFFHDHSRLDSPIHRLPAALKLGGALGLVFTAVLLPASQGMGFAILAAILVLVAAASSIPPLFLLKRLLLLEPFVLGVAVLSLLQPGGARVFMTLLIRTHLCLLAMILLSNTTPFNDLLRVLRRARVPLLFITTLTLMHRYLFVLVEEAERMRRARLSRTFTPGRRLPWHSLSTILSQLFVRASERAGRIYDAMCARGWK